MNWRIDVLKTAGQGDWAWFEISINARIWKCLFNFLANNSYAQNRIGKGRETAPGIRGDLDTLDTIPWKKKEKIKQNTHILTKKPAEK